MSPCEWFCNLRGNGASLQAAELPGTRAGTKELSLHILLLRRDGQRGRYSSFAISSQASAALPRATTKVSVNSNDETSSVSVQISVKYPTTEVRPGAKQYIILAQG